MIVELYGRSWIDARSRQVDATVRMDTSIDIELLGREVIDQVIAHWPPERRPGFCLSIREAADVVAANFERKLTTHSMRADYLGGW